MLRLGSVARMRRDGLLVFLLIMGMLVAVGAVLGAGWYALERLLEPEPYSDPNQGVGVIVMSTELREGPVERVELTELTAVPFVGVP